MPIRKKQLQQYQIEKILQKRNIILFYQYSNGKAQEWKYLKKSLVSAILPDPLEAGWGKTPHGFLINEKVANQKLVAQSPAYEVTGLSSFFDEKLINLPRGEEATFLAPSVTFRVKNRLGLRCVTSTRLKLRQLSLPYVGAALEAFQSEKKQSQSLVSHTGSICQSSWDSSRDRLSSWDSSRDRLSSCDVLMEEKKWENLLQGPTFFFACNSHHQMVTGHDVISKNANRQNSVSLVGGVYYKKTMSHLDLIKLCKLDAEVYTSLVCTLSRSVESLINQRLSFYQSRLLFYLDCHISTLKSVEKERC